MLNLVTISVTQCITMNSAKNIKFNNAQQAKQIYQYKHIKEKLYKPNEVIWYSKYTIQKQHVQNVFLWMNP
jgi:hypothetical protein